MSTESRNGTCVPPPPLLDSVSALMTLPRASSEVFMRLASCNDTPVAPERPTSYETHGMHTRAVRRQGRRLDPIYESLTSDPARSHRVRIACVWPWVAAAFRMSAEICATD